MKQEVWEFRLGTVSSSSRTNKVRHSSSRIISSWFSMSNEDSCGCSTILLEFCLVLAVGLFVLCFGQLIAIGLEFAKIEGFSSNLYLPVRVLVFFEKEGCGEWNIHHCCRYGEGNLGRDVQDNHIYVQMVYYVVGGAQWEQGGLTAVAAELRMLKDRHQRKGRHKEGQDVSVEKIKQIGWTLYADHCYGSVMIILQIGCLNMTMNMDGSYKSCSKTEMPLDNEDMWMGATKAAAGWEGLMKEQLWELLMRAMTMGITSWENRCCGR